MRALQWPGPRHAFERLLMVFLLKTLYRLKFLVQASPTYVAEGLGSAWGEVSIIEFTEADRRAAVERARQETRAEAARRGRPIRALLYIPLEPVGGAILEDWVWWGIWLGVAESWRKDEVFPR